MEREQMKDTKETSRTAKEQRKLCIWKVQSRREKVENRVFTEEEVAAMELVREEYGKVKRRTDKQLMRLIDEYPESRQAETYIEAMHTWKTWKQDGRRLIEECKTRIRKNYKERDKEEVIKDIKSSAKINEHMKRAVQDWIQSRKGMEWMQGKGKRKRQVEKTRKGNKKKREREEEREEEEIVHPLKGARAASRSQMGVQHPGERACTPSQTKLN